MYGVFQEVIVSKSLQGIAYKISRFVRANKLPRVIKQDTNEILNYIQKQIKTNRFFLELTYMKKNGFLALSDSG